MNIGRLLKTAIKLAPIIYPIVRKVMNEKKQPVRQFQENNFSVCKLF